jgi:hypothetical protein
VGPKAVLDAVVKRKIPSPRTRNTYNILGRKTEGKDHLGHLGVEERIILK